MSLETVVVDTEAGGLSGVLRFKNPIKAAQAFKAINEALAMLDTHVSGQASGQHPPHVALLREIVSSLQLQRHGREIHLQIQFPDGLVPKLLAALIELRSEARRSVRSARIRGFGSAIELYRAEHSRYPRTLGDLIEDGAVGPGDLYVWSDQDYELGNGEPIDPDYIYVRPTSDEPLPDTPVVIEKARLNDDGKGVWLLQADGAVMWVETEEHNRILKQMGRR
jgi:hypothetical protein